MAKVTNPTPTYNFGVQQGSDHQEIFNVFSETNVLANLSNWTGHIQFRDADMNLMLDSDTTPSLLTLTENGQVILNLLGSITTDLTVPDPSDSWLYDVKITSPGADRHYTLVTGTMTIFREITQP